MVRKTLNISMVTKKLDLYVYTFQKCVYTKDILISLNVFILWKKDEKRLNKYITIREKVCNIIKKKFNSEHVSNKKYIKKS